MQWVLEARGLSARGLSLQSGLSQSHVGQIARGKLGAGVGGDILARIAKAAGIDAAWLITGEGHPEPGAVVPESDPLPRRTLAAELAREDGVHDAAIQSVLIEAPEEGAAARSTLWWAWRMRAREYDMLRRDPDPPPATARLLIGRTERKSG